MYISFFCSDILQADTDSGGLVNSGQRKMQRRFGRDGNLNESAWVASGSQTETNTQCICRQFFKIGNKSTQSLDCKNLNQTSTFHITQENRKNKEAETVRVSWDLETRAQTNRRKGLHSKRLAFNRMQKDDPTPPKKQTSTGAARHVECLRVIGSSAAVEMETVP